MDKLDHPGAVIALLAAGLVLFTGIVLLCAWLWPANDKLFAFVVGIAGNFSGALFMYLQRRGPEKPE